MLPIGWESHSSPEMGNSPQSIINKQVLEKSDVLVGVFWTRLGTPTSEYQSGTVEEIEKHIKSGKLTMLYFSSKPVEPDSIDPNQYGELKKFKESCKNRSLYEHYDNLNDFKDLFYKHLQLKLNEHAMFKESSSVISDVIRPSNISVPILTDVAKQLLKEISEDPQGQVMSLRTITGTIISTNGKNLCTNQEARELAKWKGAIDNLVNEQLIVRTGIRDDIYTITDLGFQVADTIEFGIA